MWKWLFSGLFVISTALAVYCFGLSASAQKVVNAVNGPPVLQVRVDFSKPFTNEFAFRHTAEPFYGTTYLTLKADPCPGNWTNTENACDDLKEAHGQMRVISTNNAVIKRGNLDWFYWMRPRSEPENAPLQGFFPRLPLGDYRLHVETTTAVPQLSGAKQELILRYDYIHESSISHAFRILGVVFAVIAGIGAIGLFWQIKRHPEIIRPPTGRY